MKNKIKFSIVIALAPWREAEIIPYIKKQDYPKNKFEIIVIKGLNVPDNRNNGVKKAKGEIVVFLDDDAIIERDLLNKMDKFFMDHPEIDILGGPQLTPRSDKLFAKISGYALGSPFGAFGFYKRYTKAKLNLNADSSYITGANLTVKRNIFKKIKFDRKIYPADDVNFVNLAKEAGFKVGYSPEILIYHRRRANLRGLIEQIFDYGQSRSNKKLAAEHNKIPFFLIPSLFLIYLLSLPALYFISKLFLIPLSFYIALSLIFSIYESFKNYNFMSLFILPFLFLTIHLSYGAGVLYKKIKNIFNK